MALEKEIKIKVDKNQADKSIQDLNKELENADKSANELNSSLDNTSKAAKKGEQGVSNMSKATKALGTSLKALGIGLILGLFAKLVEVFSQNQKVMDVLTNVSNGLSIAFNDLFGYLEKTLPKIINFFKDVFENPQKHIKNLGNAIKENLIERFKSLFEATTLLGKAMLKLFTGEFQQAADLGKDALKEFADVLTGIDGTVDKVVETTERAVKSITEYTKETYNQAKAITELNNTAKIAAAEQQRLVEVYDRQAEKLRQLRDDDSLTIAERIKNNEALNDVLNNQEKAMLNAANAQVAAAQATLNQNKNIENRVALIEALANKEGVLAQIEGFRSEQLANRVALIKEQQELENLGQEAEIERQIQRKEFETEQEQDELRKFELQKERLNLENELLLQDLERKREIYKEGTLAREEAEQEYLTAKERIEQQITLTEQKENEKRKEVTKAAENAKLQIAGQTLGLIGGLLEEGSALAKGVAVAQATISGIEGVQNAFTSGAKNPITTVFPAFPFVQAGLAGAFSALQIGKILSTDSSGKGVGASNTSSSGGGGITAPSFNLVSGTAESQLNESIQQQNQRPVQAFVVSRSVTSAQEMDRNIEGAATI